MSERYIKLFSLPENLYADDSPVAIAAGALTKDNQTGKVFVQLRLQNTDAKFRNLIALKVSFTSYDPARNILGAVQEYQYLDLDVPRGVEFGGNIAIALDNPATRSFEVNVIEAVFSEGTPWTGKHQEWVSLGRRKTLEESLGEQLAEQYRRDTFSGAKYELFANHGVWMCACGALNSVGENSCCHCHNNKGTLVKALDHSVLAKHLNDYRAEVNKHIQQKKEDKRKTAKIITMLLLPFVLIGLFFGAKSYMAHQKEAELEFEKRSLEALLCSDAWVKRKDGKIAIQIDFYEGGTAYFDNHRVSGAGYWKVIDGNTFEFCCSAWTGGEAIPYEYDIVYDENGVPFFDSGSGVHTFRRISDFGKTK